jgi:hypothetical protein
MIFISIVIETNLLNFFLCKCVEEYKINNVEYLLAEEKTHEPEEDEDAGKSLLEVGMEQLQRVDRVQALESLMAYKSLADDIKTYLETFKDTGKVVTKQDIEDFFAVSNSIKIGSEIVVIHHLSFIRPNDKKDMNERKEINNYAHDYLLNKRNFFSLLLCHYN